MAGQCLWENLFWVRDPWYAVVGKVLHQKATKGSVSYSHSINENNDMLIFQCVDGWVSQYNQIGVSGYLLTTASYNGPIQLRQWWIQLAYITKPLTYIKNWVSADILQYLELSTGSVVSSSINRIIKHTFEFYRERVDRAREVTGRHSYVCAEGYNSL